MICVYLQSWIIFEYLVVHVVVVVVVVVRLLFLRGGVFVVVHFGSDSSESWAYFKMVWMNDVFGRMAERFWRSVEGHVT